MHRREPSNKEKYDDEHLKPDATCHDKKQNMGTESKKAKLPGQIGVPKRDHNESDFVGEKH